MRAVLKLTLPLPLPSLALPPPLLRPLADLLNLTSHKPLHFLALPPPLLLPLADLFLAYSLSTTFHFAVSHFASLVADSSSSFFLLAVSCVLPLFTAVLEPLATQILILESCLAPVVPEPLAMRAVLELTLLLPLPSPALPQPMRSLGCCACSFLHYGTWTHANLDLGLLAAL